MFYTIDTRIDVDLELFFDSILIQCCYKKRIVLPMIDTVWEEKYIILWNTYK